MWKKNYKNVVYLYSLEREKPHLGVKILELLLWVRGERSTSRMHLIVARVEAVNEWPMSAILYLENHMAFFLVWSLNSILYIVHDVSFCKKMYNWVDFEYTHTHTFHGMCSMNWSVYLFDANEWLWWWSKPRMDKTQYLQNKLSIN